MTDCRRTGKPGKFKGAFERPSSSCARLDEISIQLAAIGQR
jgi:hypothetical protein